MMNLTGHLLFLGTGASMGVPIIGCTCAVCLSTSQHNKRLRSSLLCKIGHQNILIDCGPDFRNQALRYQINHLDGVIFTHAHNDHTAGIDDLKIYTLLTKEPLKCLLSRDTAFDLRRRFYYLFESKYPGAATPFDMHVLDHERGSIDFLGLQIRYFTYEQMGMKVNGFRFGNLAYVSDIRHYPETIFEDLQGVHTLITSALRFTPSQMHQSVDEAIDFASKAGAAETWLMHVSHEIEHEKTNAYLPENVRVAYDGLQIEFQPDIVV